MCLQEVNCQMFVIILQSTTMKLNKRRAIMYNINHICIGRIVPICNNIIHHRMIFCLERCKWDLETGKKTMDFPAHAGDVVSISLSADGNTYITGSVDRTCKLWDIREETAKQTFFGHEADVNSVCVSRATKVMYTSRVSRCQLLSIMHTYSISNSSNQEGQLNV